MDTIGEMGGDFFSLAVDAASTAAKSLTDRFALNAGVQLEAGRDIKTEADLAAESILLELLKPTGLPILSEEGGGAALEEVRSRRHWIIDPLDGTFNFSRRFPMACVSVALWNGRRPELGVVADLARGRVVAGGLREGLKCRGAMPRVSSIADTERAVLATGFPSGRSYDAAGLRAFLEAVQRFKKVRLLGSAALSLAYVAEGVFEAYCEEDIWLWDVAAGLALVLAAGGVFWMTPPNHKGKVTVFASNGLIFPPDALFAVHENLEKYTDA